MDTDGMFVLILPVVMLPAIYILRRDWSLSASSYEHRGRLSGRSSGRSSHSRHTISQSRVSELHSRRAGPKQVEDESHWQLIKNFMVKMDLGGLVLIGLGVALLLLPLTLAKSTERDWTHRM